MQPSSETLSRKGAHRAVPFPVLISFLGSHPSIADTYTYSGLILSNHTYLWGVGNRFGLLHFRSVMHRVAGMNAGL